MRSARWYVLYIDPHMLPLGGLVTCSFLDMTLIYVHAVVNNMRMGSNWMFSSDSQYNSVLVLVIHSLFASSVRLALASSPLILTSSPLLNSLHGPILLFPPFLVPSHTSSLYALIRRYPVPILFKLCAFAPLTLKHDIQTYINDE